MYTSKEEQQDMLHRIQRSFGESQGDKRLCLLSLDGGGVRGLSSLYILRKIMTKVSAERQKKGQGAVKPFQVFDLIGGTSTGGLIAILLGRLEMSVDECIDLYKKLMGAVFGQKEHFLKIKLTSGKMQNVFSQEPLKRAIVELLQTKGIPEDQLYDDGQERVCRTFVVARRAESTNPVVIRDYTEPGETNDDKLTIVEAALATSAASSVFPPLEARGKQYVDGALGTNNPTPLVWQLAQDIWANHDGIISDKVNTFISVGTGKSSFSGIKKSVWAFLTDTLQKIVTQTEETEKNFAKDHRFLIPFEGEQRYYRFNVESGLEDIDIEEHEKVEVIEVATNEYIEDSQQRKYEVARCSARVALKELKKHSSISFSIQRTSVFLNDEDKVFCNECIATLLQPKESFAKDIPWYRRREETIKKSNYGSLGWLWEADTSLSKWTAGKGGTFWIRGKEGSGKSVAMKHFLNGYREKHKYDIVIGFFFTKLGSELERSLEGLLRVVLARILRVYPAFFTCIKGIYNDIIPFVPHLQDRETMFAEWTLPHLTHALEHILNNTQLEARIVLFVDAINECHNTDPEELIETFRSFSEVTSNVSLKICFSSTTDILAEEKYAELMPGLIMQDKTRDDLGSYIRDCFNEGTSSAQFDENDLAEILADVLSKAEGCWLWVEYAVSMVNKRSSTLDDVKRGLKKLPKEMNTLYETFLTNVDETHAEEANNILAVVLAMSVVDNALSVYVNDLRYILGFLAEDRYESQAAIEKRDKFMKTNKLLRSRIQDHFSHLLIVQNLDDDDDDDDGPKDRINEKPQDRNGRVQLYHSTVRNFLFQRETAGQSLILTGPELERRGLEIVTKACLRFIQCKEARKLMQDLESRGVEYLKKIEDERALLQRLPLLVLTLSNFLAASCHAIQRNTANAEELKAFWTSQNFEAWKTTINLVVEEKIIDPEETLTAMCIPTDCDIFVRYQIEHQGVDPGELIPDFGSYLCLAACQGSTKVVKMLLSLDRPVGIDFCSSLGTPLTVAAALGHKEIVETLLNHDADPDISGGTLEDPLAAAASSLNFDILRLLWEHPNSSSSLKHSKDRTSKALISIAGAIRYAVFVDDLEPADFEREDASGVIQTLALNGLDMTIFTHMSIPLFLWSLCVQSTDLMDLMLQDPIFILSKSRADQSLLHIVSSAGPLSMVKLIVQKYADLEHPIDQTDMRDCTILHYAATNSNSAVMEYFLSLNEPALDPNAPDLYGITPLHAAFACGSTKLIRMLIKAGANLDAEGPQGLLMVHFAASNIGNSEALQEFFADRPVNVTDHFDRTPLHIAAQYGNDAAVRWLLDHDLDVSTPDDRGRTALHCACENQSPSATRIIRTLLERGALPTTRDSEGSTPLHLAFHDPEYASQCLFWNIISTNYWDKFSEVECERKAFTLLALDGEQEFVNVQDSEGNTALHLACSRGLGVVITALIRLGAKLDLRDKRGSLAYQLIQNAEAREVLARLTGSLSD